MTAALHLPILPLAACRGAHEPLWDDHIDGETPEQRDHRHELAITVCGSCPERAACQPGPEDTGVWGGIVYSNARDITCDECGHEFTDPHGRRRYCSHTCRETAKNRQRAAILRTERHVALPGLPNCQVCGHDLTEKQRINKVRNCSQYCRKAANRNRKRARKTLTAQHDPLRGAA